MYASPLAYNNLSVFEYMSCLFELVLLVNSGPVIYELCLGMVTDGLVDHSCYIIMTFPPFFLYNNNNLLLYTHTFSTYAYTVHVIHVHVYSMCVSHVACSHCFFLAFSGHPQNITAMETVPGTIFLRWDVSYA